MISYLNTGFRIADKECHKNYVSISKGQHWRFPAKKLEEESTTTLQGWQEKTRGKEKLKLIWINQVYGWQKWYLGSKEMFFFVNLDIGYALPLSHIISTCESYHQYLWVISSVPVSHPQFPWGYAAPVSHILSTCESYPQYPWGYAAPVSKFIWMKNEWNFPHGYCISSQVLHTLTGTEDMTHGYCISLVENPARILYFVGSYTGSWQDHIIERGWQDPI